MTKYLGVAMKDGSVWGVPLEVIARDRARHYAKEFDGDVERSMKEDTMPLFESDSYEAEDWAANNMNWSEVAKYAKKIAAAPGMTDSDFQDGWVNGSKEVMDVAE